MCGSISIRIFSTIMKATPPHSSYNIPAHSSTNSLSHNSPVLHCSSPHHKPKQHKLSENTIHFGTRSRENLLKMVRSTSLIPWMTSMPIHPSAASNLCLSASSKNVMGTLLLKSVRRKANCSAHSIKLSYSVSPS